MIVMRIAAMVAMSWPAAVAAAPACGDSLGPNAQRVESSRYVIAYTTTPAPIAVGKHFIVDFAVCPRTGAIAPQSVRIDATMPDHKHGMNYKPVITVVRPGTYHAEGLLFHMPGRWEMTFDVVAGNTTERLAMSTRIE